MRRGGLWLILTGVLAWPASVLAEAGGPSVMVWKVDSSAAGQRAVMVQISNPSAGPVCIARDFSSRDRLSVWRSGKRLALKRDGARSRPAPGCALLPPGRSRTALFRPWRDGALPGGTGLKACYRISWRNDAATGREPDSEREVCQVFH